MCRLAEPPRPLPAAPAARFLDEAVLRQGPQVERAVGRATRRAARSPGSRSACRRTPKQLDQGHPHRVRQGAHRGESVSGASRSPAGRAPPPPRRAHGGSGCGAGCGVGSELMFRNTTLERVLSTSLRKTSFGRVLPKDHAGRRPPLAGGQRRRACGGVAGGVAGGMVPGHRGTVWVAAASLSGPAWDDEGMRITGVESTDLFTGSGATSGRALQVVRVTVEATETGEAGGGRDAAGHGGRGGYAAPVRGEPAGSPGRAAPAR